MGKKVAYKIFDIIGHGVDINVSNGSKKYLEKIEFRYFKPKELTLDSNNISIVNTALSTIIILKFKGGTLVDRPTIISTPPRPANFSRDFTSNKVELKSFVEIHFDWESYSNDSKVAPAVPESSGKSILVI